MTHKVWDPELSAFMKLALSQVKVRSAAEIGKRAVEYCRGDDLLKCIYNNRDFVNSRCLTHLESPIATEGDAIRFGDALIKNGFIYRSQYKPLDGVSLRDETGMCKRPKWPTRLQITPKQQFDVTGFYVIVYEGTQHLNHLLLGLVILVVLIGCMFPAWPLQMKLALWYVSVVFLTAIIALIVIRLVVFILLWIAVIDFWIFPNMFDEELGVVDSFRPLYSCKVGSRSITMMVMRALVFVIGAVSIYSLRTSNKDLDIGKFAKQSFIDVLDWGYEKLTAVPEENTHKYIASTPIVDESEGVDGENADKNVPDEYECLKSCGYNGLEDLMKTCVRYCSCMRELMEKECIQNCNEEIISLLTEAMNESCEKEKRKESKKKHAA